jgi:uncharacterized membrane protein YkgB
MNEKYLDKVLNQIVSETKINSEGRVITTFTPLSNPLSARSPFFLYFYDHCRDIYGLTEDEIHYLWEKYKFILENGL